MNDDQRSGADYVSVDAAATTHAAGQLLDRARELATGAGGPLSDLDIGPRAYGALPSSGALAAAHQDSLDDLGDLIGRLGEILEGDADRLYRVAARVTWTDTSVAQRFGGGR